MGSQLALGPITIDREAIRDFCERWKIVELAYVEPLLPEREE